MALALVLGAGLSAGCSRREAGAGAGTLVTIGIDDLVRAGEFEIASGAPPAAALILPTRPRVERVASGLHWRTAVVTGAGSWSWELVVPARGRLHLGLE